MIKEILLAIILGSLLGFGITGGYLAVKKSQVQSPTEKVNTLPSPTINPQMTPSPITPTPISDNNQSDHKITIDSPENESVNTSAAVTLKGSTSPQSYLIVNTPLKSYFATADNAGNFSIDIEVDSGPNIIHIDSYDSQDNSASTQLLVTYSTAKF